MAQITFQIIEGLEAGRIHRNVATPLTIGREEDNDIQLNDERVSRFHIKIQEDSGRLILTDLDSTNGTRVNGHPVRLRVLQKGDLIMLGRSVLLLGGTEELRLLSQRLQQNSGASGSDDELETVGNPLALPIEASEFNTAFPNGPPPVPSHLTAAQTAELVDLLDYVRTELLAALSMPVEKLRTDEGIFQRVERSAWLRLEALSPEIARIVDHLTSPH